MESIQIRNARLHNLKGIDLDIPKSKLVVITGVSGSGKSSLAFDLLYAEGRRRYLQLIGEQVPPESDAFDTIRGLSPAIAVEQQILRQSNPRSTVGTRTKIYHNLQLLFALGGDGADPVRLPPAIFSPNTAEGMCLRCFGRGLIPGTADEERLLAGLTADQPLWRRTPRLLRKGLERLAAAHGFTVEEPYSALSPAAQERFLHGCPTTGFEGLLPFAQRVSRGAPAGGDQEVCPSCQGYRLGPEGRSVTIEGLQIGQVANLTLTELADFLRRQAESKGDLGPLALRMRSQVGALLDVGLAHLSLWRSTPTLSGGELQRLFLAAYLNADLENLLYLFDEPSVGLHELEKGRLIERLRHLQAAGNTVLVVEHDPLLIEAADHLIEIGPGAGAAGGRVVYQGTVEGYKACQGSPIVAALAAGAPTEKRRPLDTQPPKLTLHNAQTNNLKRVTVSLPLGRLVGVAGLSGSGKSTLISKTLVPLLQACLKSRPDESDPDEDEDPLSPLADGLTGWDSLARVLTVTQLPIGRNKSSTPASHIGLWDRIRAALAGLPAAQALGLTASHFSFNAAGACPACQGEGETTIYVGGQTHTQRCAACQGQRFRPEVLQVRIGSNSVYDLLQLTAAEALPLFRADPAITALLQTLCDVGLGYLTLGQPSPTLSGGEAQRLKLAKELGRRQSGPTLYVLDEPTSGLSAADTLPLLQLLDRLVAQGHSVIVIEHDPAVLSGCDWLIELGPGGGRAGGTLIAEGSPADLRTNPDSLIGPFLRSV